MKILSKPKQSFSFFINYHNIEPIKFDILTDYLTVFVDCHDAPLGRAAHSARHAAALSCHRRDCFHLRVGNEKMWELDMILRLKSCNWHSVDKNYLIFWYLLFLEKLKIISKVISFCDVMFGQTCHVEEHILSVHEGKKAFKCDFCDISYTTKSILKKHISIIHEGRKK